MSKDEFIRNYMCKMQNEQIVSLSTVQDESLTRWLAANGKTEAAETDDIQ